MEAFSESFSSSKYSYMRSIGKKFRKYSHTNLDSLYNDEMSRWRPDEKIMIERSLKVVILKKTYKLK